MNVLIQLYPNGEFLRAEDGLPFSPPEDRFHFRDIEASTQLGKWLQQASDSQCTVYWDSPEGLAANIAKELSCIREQLPEFSSEPILIIPEPLASALKCPVRMAVADFISSYASQSR